MQFEMSALILHQHLPADLIEARPLPGIRPVQGAWLHVDEAYGAQMAERERLIEHQRPDVIYLDGAARPAADELRDLILGELPSFGFDVDTAVQCPDGRSVRIEPDDPLGTLGRLVQCDLCILQKHGDEHILTGAVLCFPASWRLIEKAGHPLTRIHDPVPEYDAELARRVQRLFDGVQVGRPIWRFNRLWYEDPALYQPRSETLPRTVMPGQSAPFYRSERQTVFRLPVTGAVVFAIHTYVLRRADVPDQLL